MESVGASSPRPGWGGVSPQSSTSSSGSSSVNEVKQRMSYATRVINRTLREPLKKERLITTGQRLENTSPEKIKTYLRQKIATVSLWQNLVVSGG